MSLNQCSHAHLKKMEQFSIYSTCLKLPTYSIQPWNHLAQCRNLFNNRSSSHNDFVHITGCASHFGNPTNFKIVKEPLLVLKQTMLQQKALDLSFNLTPWKWAWHYHEAARPSRPQKPFFTPRAPMLFAARRCGGLLVEPRPLLGSQIKAEIKGFLLMYRLFLY